MPSAITPWRTQVKVVRDGEQVRASVTNRPTDDLTQRTQHLKDRLDGLTGAEMLIAYNVPVSADVKVGFAVYWDAIEAKYKPALAKVAFDPAVNAFRLADSAYVVGIVLEMAVGYRANVGMVGLLRDFDFTNAIGAAGGDVEDAGPYFLSGSVAGHYTKMKPPVGIYVGYLRGDSSAHVAPTPREILETHLHYAIQLYAQPAGRVNCPAPNEQYTFISADDTQPGWLPADHPVFDGNAPAGAVFGYNLAMHPELSELWPPIPSDTVFLEFNGLGVLPGKFIVDLNGLWWTENCYGKAPWAIEVRPCGVESSSSSPSSSSSSSSSSMGLFCDAGALLEQMGFLRADPGTAYMRLYFTKMTYRTGTSIVTSLTPAAGSPITVRGCDGNPANKGDLIIDIDLASQIIEDQPGYNVLKDVDGFVFKRGPIVSGLKPGPNVSISVVPGKGELDGDTYRGDLVISANEGQTDLEGALEITALNGAREDSESGAFFLSFPQALNTNFRMRLALQTTGLGDNLQMEVWFWLMARASGVALPTLPCSYRRVPRPDSCDPVSLPLADTALADLDPSVCGALVANDYVEVVSEAFPVAQGEQIYFQLGRLATDGYPADIGILRAGFRLSTI